MAAVVAGTSNHGSRPLNSTVGATSTRFNNRVDGPTLVG